MYPQTRVVYPVYMKYGLSSEYHIASLGPVPSPQQACQTNKKLAAKKIRVASAAVLDLSLYPWGLQEVRENISALREE